MCRVVDDSAYKYFFFSSRRRHTRLQGNWSSDVCSSDLSGGHGPFALGGDGDEPATGVDRGCRARQARRPVAPRAGGQIGRASCRERVWISVVAVFLKEEKANTNR